MINPRSIIFLLILFSLFLFLAGFRLGKKIERIDKTYVPLLTPTTTPKPTTTPLPLKFNTFSSTDCGIKFLYPDYFKEKETATDEASLVNNDEKITLDCRKLKFEEFNKNKKTYQLDDEITIRNQGVQIYKAGDQKNNVLFLITNPQDGKKILITLPENLLNLFAKTVEFSQ
jgi:hypothetical protein